MGNWKSLAILSAVLSLAMTAASASCYQTIPPCEMRQMGNWAEVAVDLLYWKPYASRVDAAAILKEGRCVKYDRLCPEWHTGVRGVLRLPDLFCSWDFVASYASINFDHTIRQKVQDLAADSGIVSPLIFPQEEFLAVWEKGKEKLDLKYAEWDLLLRYEVYRGPCHLFSPYFGIAGIQLKQELEAAFSLPFRLREAPSCVEEETSLDIDWKSSYSGVGIAAGAYYECRVLSCLTFFSKADILLLTGEGSTTNEQEVSVTGEDDLTVTITEDGSCHYVSGCRMQAGINYHTSYCGCEWNFRLGYEFHYLQHVPNERYFYGDSLQVNLGHAAPARTRSLGFHGLFAGLSTTF